MAEPDPAKLAAIDQQLAALGDRLDRNARRVTHGDVALLLLALAEIIYILAARFSVSYWDLAIVWVIIALAAAGGLVKGRMLRSYRAEIRELRSGGQITEADHG